MLVGIIDHQTGTRDIDKLSGLRRGMPLTFAMIALRPFYGRSSVPQWVCQQRNDPWQHCMNPPVAATCSPWRHASPGYLAGSAFTTIYCLILALKLFFGPVTVRPRKNPGKPSWGLLV